MKASNYNFFFPHEADSDKIIAYNSFSNALALMDKDKYKVFTCFIDSGKNIEDKEFLEQLKVGRFLVDSECDELGLLRLRMLKSRYQTRSLGLTITPTTDCNFRCTYCYEEDIIKPNYMSIEVQDKIIDLVRSQANTLSYLSVAWYGGEPLMALDIVERMSKSFLDICEENGIAYNSNIITNGYLLTRENAELLKKLQVSSMQVTIDGNKDMHDQRRPLIDGFGTFDTILGNLLESKDILPPVSIRVNVDKYNVKQAEDVMSLLSKLNLLDKVKPYLGKVNPDNNTYDASKCFDICGFSEVDFDYFSKYIDELGYNFRYPRIKSNVCTADAVNSFVIDASGFLYKCWVDIGNIDASIGNLLINSNANDTLHLNYMLHDATENSICSDCNLLPVCMGGCPYRRVNDQDTCSTYKYKLESYLITVSQKIIAHRINKSKPGSKTISS
ncbi:MAG: SPASM domain-containing protein [Defluviitaleaceae bacterium]|nr:SPASM domain-containing protein [Defluviitaleaceae bacterium]